MMSCSQRRVSLSHAADALIAATIPHRVLVAGKGTDDLPLMEGRASATMKAYVCEAYACLEPTDDPARLRELLGA